MVHCLPEVKQGHCHNVRTLLGVGLHWRVPFIEDLLENVQVVW